MKLQSVSDLRKENERLQQENDGLAGCVCSLLSLLGGESSNNEVVQEIIRHMKAKKLGGYS